MLRIEDNPRTGPADTPVSVAEVKTHSRIVGTSQDTYITDLIPAVCRFLQRRTGRQIITATWGGYLDCFPPDADYFEIPVFPLASVSFVKYYDTDGALQTWAAANYIVDTVSRPGSIWLHPDTTDWPDVHDGRRNAVEVEFVAGQALANVSADVKHLVKLLCAHWFENREPVDSLNYNELPYTLRSMIRALKPRAIR
jgi:uncharacterized phiE125 gp8 family phage protein